MATPEKRARTEIDCLDSIRISDTLRLKIADSLECLCSANPFKNVLLIPLKIKNSNAADSESGFFFSNAYCEVTDERTGFLIADVFRRGLDIILDYIHDHKFPEKRKEEIVFMKLLDFLNADEAVPSVHGLTDVTEFTTFLANHLFGKLATTTTYTISEKKSGKKTKQCLCGKEGCTLTGRYGDTSIGNPTVWHGSPDIILNNSLPIEPITEGSGGPDGRSGVLVHKKSSSLSKNPQMIAETIVFSFLQKHLHPERDNFLTPCIGVGFSEFLGVGFSELFVMLYDSEHDVLLESCKIPLSSPTQPNKFNMTAVLLSWLVVNYKFLCTGLTDEMKAFYKADFFEKAGPKLQVYNELLSMGNVAGVNLNDPSLPQYCFKDNSYLLARRRKLKEVVEEVENRFSQAGFSGGD